MMYRARLVRGCFFNNAFHCNAVSYSVVPSVSACANMRARLLTRAGVRGRLGPGSLSIFILVVKTIYSAPLRGRVGWGS